MREYKICFIRHKSAKRVVLAFFKPDYPDMSDEDLIELDTEFPVMINGRKYPGATIEQFLKAVREYGIWGFCQDIKCFDIKEIHYWKGKRANNKMVIELFGHEIAHACGIKSEQEAIQYGGIAAMAYDSLLKEFNNEHED